jgi:hypothetical protein
MSSVSGKHVDLRDLNKNLDKCASRSTLYRIMFKPAA